MFCGSGLSTDAGRYPSPDCGRRGGRRSLGHRRADRTGDDDLHGSGVADEDRIGTPGAVCRSARPVDWAGLHCLGLVPGSPAAVTALGAHSGGGVGQVPTGQRDHRKRLRRRDFADCDAAGETDQRLLVEPNVTGAWRRLIECAVDRARQDDGGSRDGGEQYRRGTARRHELMLRMCRVLPLFRHDTTVNIAARHRRAVGVASRSHSLDSAVPSCGRFCCRAAAITYRVPGPGAPAAREVQPAHRRGRHPGRLG